MAACGRVFNVWLVCLTYLILLAGDVEKYPGPWNKSNFSIVHQNIRGLAGKIDLLSLFILKHEVSIFGVTETLLVDKIPSTLVNIGCYNFERRDRKTSDGGVGVYVRNNIDYIWREDMEFENIEQICLEILSEHSCFLSLYYIALQIRQNICVKTLQKTE